MFSLVKSSPLSPEVWVTGRPSRLLSPERDGLDRIGRQGRYESLAAALHDVAIIQIQVRICPIALGSALDTVEAGQQKPVSHKEVSGCVS